MLKRQYQDLSNYLKTNHVLIIFGPRQVGKTTLLKHYLNRTDLKYKLESGDNIRIQNLLGSQDFEQILEFAHGYELIAIDEAQQIPNIGMALKILVDEVPNLRIIATGSSSFDLSQQVGEPLTGRKVTLTLYPIAQMELADRYNDYELKQELENSLLFGGYPEIVCARTKKEKIALLKELVDSYLFKDILALEKIKSSDILVKLVKLLAFQVGQPVSHHELATSLHIDTKTVERYLDLLQKSFVIYRLGAFSKNLRNEISKKQKYYFLDVGVRNAIIAQFNPLDSRNDVGALFENFLFIERLKKLSYTNFYGNCYFWRTYDEKEIDFVEEIEGQLHAYEAKWDSKKHFKCPPAWGKAYPGATYEIVHSQNYLKFIT